MWNCKKWFALMLALMLAAAPFCAAEELPIESEPVDLNFDEAQITLNDDPGSGLNLLDTSPGVSAEEPQQAVSSKGSNLKLNVDTLSLGVGESFDLVPSMSDPPADEEIRYYFTSSRPRVAEVSSGGKVHAARRGSATITVTASNGLVATCDVSVLKKPSSIKLKNKSATLGYDELLDKGMTCKIEAKLSIGSSSHLTYTGYDPNIVSVDENGLVTAKGLGTTNVKVKTYNKKSASFSVKVLKAPDSISLNASELSMFTGETFMLKVSLPKGTMANGGFYTSDPTVAAVDEKSGEIHAGRFGSAIVTARCFNGVSAQCSVTVAPAADRVVLSDAERTLGKGESFQLKVKLERDDGQPASGQLKFASSKSNYVSVSSTGVVKGKRSDKTATITVTATGGASAKCVVKVVKAPSSIRLSAERTELTFDPGTDKGERTQLTATLSSGSASAITYSGYDPEIVNVSDEGEVVAVGLGKTTIVARTFNNRSASCTIRVIEPGTPRRTINIAHRGGAGYWPENTLEAFENTASTGADAIELDVRSTKDGVQVIHHDEYFYAGGRKRYIKSERYERLKEWKPSLCTLDEAIEVIRESGLEMHLELKKSANVGKCITAVAAHGMKDRTIYISFEKSLLTEVRSKDSQARLGLIINGVPSGLQSTVDKLRIEAIFQKQNYLKLSNMRLWQDYGLKVGVWTVDDMSEIRYWVFQGVDYITSNYPRLTTEVLNERQ